MALRFHVPPHDELPIEIERRIVLADFEGGLWPCRVHHEASLLTIMIDTSDSGCLVLPWLMPDGSELMLSTSTLVQRTSPYRMSLELARGTIYRATNELAAWQFSENVVPPELLTTMAEVQRAFASVVTHQWSADIAAQCRSVLERAVHALSDLSMMIAHALITERDEEQDQPRPLRGCRLPASNAPAEAARFRDAFDTAVVGFSWRGIEPEPGIYAWEAVDEQLRWCQQSGIRSVAGPLVNFQARKTPDWLYLFEDNRDEIIEHALGFVEQVAKRCFHRVNLWYASAGLNAARSFGLSEESRLKLAADSVQMIRQIDRQTPIMVGFEQPWGEYLARSSDDLSPLGFADILVRSNLGIAAIALELNFDVWPNGTVRRDAFAFLRKIDEWAQFQLPLIVMISAPSAAVEHETNEHRCTGAVVTPEKQAALLREVLPLLRIHRSVQGVVWNQWSDEEDAAILATGLLDESGNAKLALGEWMQAKE